MGVAHLTEDVRAVLWDRSLCAGDVQLLDLGLKPQDVIHAMRL